MKREDMNYRQGRTSRQQEDNEKLAMLGVAGILAALVIAVVVKVFK
jgi:hypothetical protein